MEPDPSNVTGEVIRQHSFEHRINWGYVVIGVAAIFLLVRLDLGSLTGSESEPVSRSDQSEMGGGIA